MKTALKIVSIVGLLFWITCCFFGLFFVSKGHWEIAIPVALLLGVALFVSYLIMLKMQDKGLVQGNRDRARVTGIIMLCAYIVATLVSAYYVNHFVKTFEYKDNIRAKVKPAINELMVTFDTTGNVEGSYLKWVEAAAGSYRNQLKLYPPEVGDTSTAIKNFYAVLKGTEPGSVENFMNFADTVNSSLSSIEYVVIDHWLITSLWQRIHELEYEKQRWENKVLEFSKKDKYAETDYPYQLQSKHDCSNISEPLTDANFKVTGTSLIVMIALQVIILLGYLLSLKTGGKQGKIVTDEHGSLRSWGNRD